MLLLIEEQAKRELDSMQLTDSAALAAVGVVSLADSDTVAVENTDLAR